MSRRVLFQVTPFLLWPSHWTKKREGRERTTLAQGTGKTNSLCFQVDTTETTYYILFWLQSLFPEQGIHETEIILRSRFLWPPL
jgi:hypothetical protein